MDNPKAIVRRTRQFGRGVFAARTIAQGEVIAAFDGPVYDDKFEPWTEDMYNHAIQFGPRIWRDSVGIARLINHSCEPNCGIKNLFEVVAMRDIKVGEHITWDYEMTEKNPDWRMHCRCGSPLCRKIIGHYKNMPRSIRKKYAGYISAWIVGRKPSSLTPWPSA